MDKKKKEQADLIVSSLDELFPDGVSAQSDYSNTHSSKGGAVGVSKISDSGDRHGEVEYLRVPEMGSVEAYRLDNGDYAITRRDKLPHSESR
jgi:hypothetical protein